MPSTKPDIDAVTALVDDVARTIILPRFRRLSREDIESKSTPADPEDVVTVVDRLVEERLTEALREMMPWAAVIGEESVYARPELLRLVASDEPLWLIDPIDGTKNLVRGDDGFGVMLAFVLGGCVRAGWILLPARGTTFVAEAGSGAFENGVRVRVPPPPSGLSRGSLLLRHMPACVEEPVNQAMRGRFHAVPDSGCAAVDYTDTLSGRREFTVFHRLMPWDHAAPALILTEGGGRVEHMDGTPYSPRSNDRLTISARDARMASQVRKWLTPDRPA